MDIYLVYFDFSGSLQTLDKLCELLNSYNGIRFQPFGWLIKTSEMPGEICEKLNNICGTGDYFMISKLDESFCCRQPESIGRWIRANFEIKEN